MARLGLTLFAVKPWSAQLHLTLLLLPRQKRKEGLTPNHQSKKEKKKEDRPSNTQKEAVFHLHISPRTLQNHHQLSPSSGPARSSARSSPPSYSLLKINRVHLFFSDCWFIPLRPIPRFQPRSCTRFPHCRTSPPPPPPHTNTQP